MSRVIVPCVLELGSVIDNHLHCACSTDLQVARDIVKEKAAAQSFQAKAEVRVNRLTSVTVRAPDVLRSASSPLPTAPQISSFQRQLCTQLRLLRQRETREELLSQWRQTMSAPEWCVQRFSPGHLAIP